MASVPGNATIEEELYDAQVKWKKNPVQLILNYPGFINQNRVIMPQNIIFFQNIVMIILFFFDCKYKLPNTIAVYW